MSGNPFKHGNQLGRYANAAKVPAAPFVAWLRDRLETLKGDRTLAPRIGGESGAQQALAAQLGVRERTLYRYLRSLDGCNRPTDTFVRERVEDMLHHAGAELEDVYPAEVLYPGFDPDPPLEPDVWCPTCGEVTTPIRGVCPWCETQAVAA